MDEEHLNGAEDVAKVVVRALDAAGTCKDV